MYHILYVDDEKDLLEIGRLFLQRGGEFSVDTITSAAEALSLMESRDYDAVVSDYQMPVMNGIEFLKRVRGRNDPVPFVLFTGRGREEVVIQALNEGADFYIQKGGDPIAQFAELAHQIRRAVERRRAEASIRDHERREEDIINFLPDATFAIDRNGVVIAWNKAIEEMTGVPADRMLGRGNYEYALPFYGDRRPILIDLLFEPGDSTGTRYSGVVRDGTMIAAETSLPHLRGEMRTLWGKASPLFDRSGKVVGAIESIRDVTERKAAEAELIKARDALEERVNQRTADLYAANLGLQREMAARVTADSALQESEERFRSLIEKAPEAILLFDVDADRYIDANAKAGTLFGCSRDVLLEGGPQQFYVPDQSDGRPFAETVREHRIRALAGEELVFERRIRTARMEDRTVEVRLVHLPTAGKKLIRSSFIDITGRKRMEDALQKSEERYRAIVEQDYQSILTNMQEVFYRIDNTGRITLISPSGARLLGYTRAEEMIGLNATAFYDDPAQREAFYSALEKDGSVSEKEYTLKRRDGSLITVATNSHIYYDRHGKRAGVEGILRDVTRRKRTEEALRLSESMFRSLFEGAAEGILVADVGTGKFIHANSVICRLLGYTEEELTKMSVKSLHPEADLPHVMQEFLAIARGEKIRAPDIPCLRKDGTVLYADVVGSQMIVGDNKYNIGFFTDATMRRQAERDLSESEEKYRTLVETSFDGIVIHQDGLIVYGNATSARLFGLEKVDDVIGRPVISFVHPDYRAVVAGRMASATQDVLPVMPEKFLRVDGSVFDVEVAARPFTWKGRPAVHVVFREVPGGKRAEEALVLTSRKLDLLSSVTRHDIVNPLTALKGYVDVSKACSSDPKFQELVRREENLIERIEREILFAREYQEIGMQAPAWQDVRSSILAAADGFDLGGISLDTGGVGDVTVFADPLLPKVFLNLLENAVRHGGETVRKVRFSSRRDGVRLVISCEDDGAGIPAEEKERIFGRGFGKHTGLGLFLIREILAITGISVRETGEPGRGARFEIIVPAKSFRAGRL